MVRSVFPRNISSKQRRRNIAKNAPCGFVTLVYQSNFSNRQKSLTSHWMDAFRLHHDWVASNWTQCAMEPSRSLTFFVNSAIASVLTTILEDSRSSSLFINTSLLEAVPLRNQPTCLRFDHHQQSHGYGFVHHRSLDYVVFSSLYNQTCFEFIIWTHVFHCIEMFYPIFPKYFENSKLYFVCTKQIVYFPNIWNF